MANIKDKIAQIRQAVFGKDVRESIASGIEKINDEVESTTGRQGDLETQFQTVLDETTGKDVISAPEITAARVDAKGGSHSNLKARLDTEHNEVMSQLAENQKNIFNSEILNHRQKKPLFSIIDDDGYLKVYTMLKPLAERYNIPISSAPITSLVGEETYPSRYNLQQMKEMQSIGMEFLSHGHTHMRFGEQPESIIDNDLKESADWLLRNGFNNTGFVIPFGSTNNTVEKVARRYFRSAIFNGGDTQINYPPINTYRLERTSNDVGLVTMKNRVDEAIANDGWLIIMTHVDGANHTQEDYDRIEYELEEFIKYVSAQGGEFVSIEEGLNIYGNVIDIGGKRTVRVGSDGSVEGSLGATHFLKYYETDINQDISKYDPQSITITHFSTINGSDVGLPENGFGFVSTYKGFTDPYNYQTFYHISTGNTYRRRFNNGAWEEWTEINEDSISLSLSLENGWTGTGFTRNIKDGSISINADLTIESKDNNLIAEIINERIPRQFKSLSAVNQTKMTPVNNFFIDNNYGLRVFNFEGLDIGDRVRINDLYQI